MIYIFLFLIFAGLFLLKAVPREKFAWSVICLLAIAVIKGVLG